MTFDRLWPDPADGLSAPELLAGIDLAAAAGRERPRVLGVMVASLDGRAALGGRSGELAGPADAALFGETRALADAVLVGPGTVAAERYGRLVTKEDRRARRAARGLDPDPVAVLASRGLDLPWDAPLFADPRQRVTVFAAADGGGSVPPSCESVEVIRLDDYGPSALLRTLRRDLGVRSVTCEGGPRLLAGLVAAGVLDELLLTKAAVLVGEGSPAEPTLLAGAAPAEPVRMTLRMVVRAGDDLVLHHAAG